MSFSVIWLISPTTAPPIGREGQLRAGAVTRASPCSTPCDVLSIFSILEMKEQIWESNGIPKAIQPWGSRVGFKPRSSCLKFGSLLWHRAQPWEQCHRCEAVCIHRSGLHGKPITTVSNIKATMSRNIKLLSDFNHPKLLSRMTQKLKRERRTSKYLKCPFTQQWT